MARYSVASGVDESANAPALAANLVLTIPPAPMRLGYFVQNQDAADNQMVLDNAAETGAATIVVVGAAAAAGGQSGEVLVAMRRLLAVALLCGALASPAWADIEASPGGTGINGVATIAQTGTSYTLVASDCGKNIEITNASAITVTTLNSLPIGCRLQVTQGGAGKITIANGSGAAKTNTASTGATVERGGFLWLNVDTNSNGTSAHFNVWGYGADAKRCKHWAAGFNDMCSTAPVCGSAAATDCGTIGTILNGYAARPAYDVPGADYAVGSPTTSYADWQSISDPKVLVNTGTGMIRIIDTPVTFDGIDFGLHGGSFIYSSVSGQVLTIKNSRLATNSPDYMVQFQTDAGTLNLINNVTVGPTIVNITGLQCSIRCTLVEEGNWFKSVGSHNIEQETGQLIATVRGNVFENFGLAPLAHNNVLQWATIGSGSTVDWSHNLHYQTTIGAAPGPGEMVQGYPNNTGTIDTMGIKNNVMIAKPEAANQTISYMIHGGAITTSGIVSGNFFDTSSNVGAFGPYYAGSLDAYIVTGNTDLRTGAAVTYP